MKKHDFVEKQRNFHWVLKTSFSVPKSWGILYTIIITWFLPVEALSFFPDSFCPQLRPWTWAAGWGEQLMRHCDIWVPSCKNDPRYTRGRRLSPLSSFSYCMQGKRICPFASNLSDKGDIQPLLQKEGNFPSFPQSKGRTMNTLSLTSHSHKNAVRRALFLWAARWGNTDSLSSCYQTLSRVQLRVPRSDDFTSVAASSSVP